MPINYDVDYPDLQAAYVARGVRIEHLESTMEWMQPVINKMADQKLKEEIGEIGDYEYAYYRMILCARYLKSIAAGVGDKRK
jgi:hypothetical protein